MVYQAPHRQRLPMLPLPILAAALAAVLGGCGADPDHWQETVAKANAEMQPYTEAVPGTGGIEFEMLPIPGGAFTLGSPEDEPGRRPDEGPQRTVRISPFWMMRTEVTWDLYNQWSADLERLRRPDDVPADAAVRAADAIARPTPPYTDMTFGMGEDGFPAICMTQKAAKTFCAWLSARTGRFYRLPTEAEWEYAARAGTTTAYSFGDDPAELGDHAVYAGNSGDRYAEVGTKLPNPWGLHDMHGNVAEWVLDRYGPYGAIPDGAVDPLVVPQTEYPRSVRGGSWQDPPEMLRSAARQASSEAWKARDPQIPQSVWYHTDAPFLGFRVVRPYIVPDGEDAGRYR